MNNLVLNSRNCCGCNACVQRCPKHCISINKDIEGFSYPIIDEEDCVNCGLCQVVCPIVRARSNNDVLEKNDCGQISCLAAKNINEPTRLDSSSGGVFTLLGRWVVLHQGVVFGAKWNPNWDVVHSFTEQEDGLKMFRGSKYVQSKIRNAYQQVESFLKNGRLVLFSGTPCQIAGLKGYLRRDYEFLYTIECACHGVPSPGMWHKYLQEQTASLGYKTSDIVDIICRDKCTGWRNYSVCISFTDGEKIAQFHDDNPWMRAYIRNYTLRPSCYNCKFKCKESLADMTLGDLWGASSLLPEADDNKGITSVLIHTQKGHSLIKSIRNSIQTWPLSLSVVLKYNKSLQESPYEPEDRSLFFSQIEKRGYMKAVNKMLKDPLVMRIKIRIARLFAK